MLEIVNLNFSYENKEVFHNATFVIKENEVVHLRGDNGVGKTTFYKIISGIYNIEPHLSTEVYINGEKIEKENLKNYVNYLPSIPYLFDYLSGFENIDYLLALFDLEESRDEVLDNIKKLDLFDSLDCEIFKYSLGMKAKLYIGVMIERKCPILIIDELMSNLDKASQNFILEKLNRKLHESNLSIVMSSHTSEFSSFEEIKQVRIVDKRFVQQ